MAKCFKYILLLMLAMTSLSVKVFAQTEAKKISFVDFYSDFKKCQTWYTATSYSVKINYKSFVSHVDTEVEDEFDGYIYQQNDKFKMFSMGIITVINGQLIFTVDTSEASIMIGNITKNEKLTEEEKKEEELLHLEAIQEEVQSVAKRDLANGYRYEIIYNAGSEYQKVIIEMNKKFQLQKQIFYYSEQINQEDNSKSKPRLEVQYKDFITDAKFDSKEFNESNYFVKTNKGYLGIGPYKTYEVFDTRIK